MIKGLGNDIIEVDRIKKLIVRYHLKFLDRVFTQKEQEYCLKFKHSEKNFAGRFAAKEAIVKAIGDIKDLAISWLDIEVLNDQNGKPIVYLSARLSKKIGGKFLLTISHCNNYAAAVAIHLET